MKQIGLKGLIFCTLLLSAFAIIEFDPYSSNTNAQTARCMDVKNVGRNGGTTTDNCTVCRPDKDQKGEIKIDAKATTPLGTYGVKPTDRDTLTSPIDCLSKINEDETKSNQYDQETKISYCELYDNHGLCIRCMINYGLQWKASSSTEGVYTCVENRNRTPYCHRYNNAGVCVECKWNQDAEQSAVYVDHAYKLDFGLFNGYCVNNLQIDYQIDTFTTNSKLASGELVSNCAKYNSDKKCERCHTRRFDMEGEIINRGTATNASSKLDFVLRVKGSSDTKPLCVVHPTDYITHPSLLIQMNATNANDGDNGLFYDKSTTDNKNKTNAQCAVGYELWKDKDSTNYGCVLSTQVTGCEKIEFDWDREAFQNTGEWYKTFKRCYECFQDTNTNGTRYFFNQDTQKCLTGFTDTTDKKCTEYLGTDCMKCKDNFNAYLIEVRTTSNSVNSYSYKRECYNTAITSTVTNCKTDAKARNYVDNTNNTIQDGAQCSECNEGYTLQQTQTFTNRQTCLKNDDSFTRGCKLVNHDKSACVTNGAWGYSSTGFCNERRLNSLSCILTTGKVSVDNCASYYHTYSSSTCIECKSGFYLVQGGSQCIRTTTTDTYVEDCEVLDGTWCQKCRNGKDTNGNVIYKVVTEKNVCKNKDAGIDQNCIHVSEDANNAQTCLQCAHGYILQTNKSCTQQSILVTPATNKKKIMTIAEYVKDAPAYVDGDEVAGCRYYFDNAGHCYECQQKDNKYVGVSVDTQNGNKQSCVVCPTTADKGLEEGDDGAGKKFLKCKNAATTYDANNVIGTEKMCEHGYAPKAGANANDPTTCTLITNYGCTKYDNTDKCIHCEWPYILNNNKCLIQQPNCITQDDTNCTKCINGYQLSGGKCYKKPDRCNTMNWEKSWNAMTSTIQTQVCEKCLYDDQTKNGLRLFINGAQQLESGCLVGCQHRVRAMRIRKDENPHNVWSCTQCRNDTFHYNQNIKWCVEATNIANCSSYTNDISKFEETCEICLTKFYLTSNKKSCTSCDLPDFCTTSDGKNSISVGGTTKCRCSVCQSTPTKYYLQADGTCKTINTTQCQTYSNEGVCTLCNTGYYLQNNSCIEYSKDLNCQTFNRFADQCLTCNREEQYLSDKFKCIAQTTFKNCKYYNQKDTKGETCDECVDGYGLRVDYKECIQNTYDTANQKYGQSKCFRYAILNNADEYWHCITCYEGFAFDYSFSKFKEDKGQCVKVDNCAKGKYKTGDTQTATQECYTCKTRDKDNFLVYRKQNAATDVIGTCTSINATANTIKRCKNYIGTSCSECHTSFQPDYSVSGTGGTICISEDHPGAIPGCALYDKVIDNTATTINWSKYEFLRCSRCYRNWVFHSFASTTSTTQLYSLNTYNRECDNVTSGVSITVPSADKWEGKDGGVIDTTDPNDKEEYDDPVLLSTKLSFSLFALLALLLAL